MEGLFSVCFSAAVDQVDKLPLGNCESIVSFTKSHIIVHVNNFPIVSTFLLSNDGNIGTLFHFLDPFNILLDPLKHSIQYES